MVGGAYWPPWAGAQPRPRRDVYGHCQGECILSPPLAFPRPSRALPGSDAPQLVSSCFPARSLRSRPPAANAQITVGRPRPDLFSRCQLPPDLTSNPVHGLTSWTVCTRTDMLQEGFRSFPSGHSSFAWTGMWYLELYLMASESA